MAAAAAGVVVDTDASIANPSVAALSIGRAWNAFARAKVTDVADGIAVCLGGTCRCAGVTAFYAAVKLAGTSGGAVAIGGAFNARA